VKVLGTRDDVVRDGRQGLELRVRVELDQAAQQGFAAYAILLDSQGKEVRTTRAGYSTPAFYRFAARFVAASASFQTGVGQKASQEATLFLPHDQVPGWKSGKGGAFKLSVKV
jgi:hypothetical protein